MLKKRLLLGFLFGWTVSVFGQRNLPDSLVTLFSRQLKVFPQEKIYLHTDKPYYITGEKIWFRAHLVDAATHVPCPVSRYVYVELFNHSDSLIARVKIGNDNDAYHGYIDIPQDIPEGGYILRAYTHFMLNLDEHYLCTKSIRIGNPLNRQVDVEAKIPATDNDFDVGFYPEGGYILQGVSCRVAFKAQMSDGRAANVEGVIYDRNGNEQGKMKTDYNGMGSFMIFSEEGASYYVVCTNERQQSKRFELPVALKTGHVLRVNSINKDNIYISVLRSAPVEGERHDTLYLLAHSRGIVHFAAQWSNSLNVIGLSKKYLPSGVLHLVLFDENMNLLSERLVFVNNDDQAFISYRNDRESFAPRSLVNNSISITDADGSPLTGSFSVTVTADHAIAADTTTNILTQLLLTSDLRGNIENPATYFNNDKSSASTLDLLMLTQGWRRYDVTALARGRPEYPTIPIELGAKISGSVKRLIVDRPKEKGMVSIVSSNGDYFDLTETDNDGRFSFNGCDQPDSVAFIIKAMHNFQSVSSELLIDEEIFPKRTLPILVPSETGKQSFEQYVEKAAQVYQDIKDIWSMDLPEVTVTAKKPVPKSVFLPTHVLQKEQINSAPKNLGMASVIEMLPKVIIGKRDILLGSMVSNNVDEEPEIITKVLYDGEEFEKIIIDDQMNKPMEFLKNCGYFYELLTTVDPEKVTEVYISVKHTRFEISGMPIKFPSISDLVIICENVNDIFYKREKPEIKTIQPLGYQKPVEYYAPRYDAPDASEKLDLRTTIHWQPVVHADSLGIATFNFYTADTESVYTIVMEGVTTEGKIIYLKEKLLKGYDVPVIKVRCTPQKKCLILRQ